MRKADPHNVGVRELSNWMPADQRPAKSSSKPSGKMAAMTAPQARRNGKKPSSKGPARMLENEFEAKVRVSY